MDKKTKDELIELGFISVGFINDLEYLCKPDELEDEEEAFTYIAVDKDGKALWYFPRTAYVNEIDALSIMKKRLIENLLVK
ncbi:hypothetical protein [Ammoniphilus sp. CFH 90114]|uniref:hypothetical protein n=1 Tax=Ammoniphilus sp. CFH 90114 TaxID=2493665 RepID=UPI00100F9DDB|nr:hypothetical protein [Ammoniphilus sp. CFH 90114]RXT06320.1 hypothetical protein EIZ39_14645 [Ammoniphilus sp. CFH 90114]